MVPNKEKSQRLIFDTREANHHFAQPTYTHLAGSQSLSSLQLPPRTALFEAQGDIQCYFYWLGQFFGLPPNARKHLPPRLQRCVNTSAGEVMEYHLFDARCSLLQRVISGCHGIQLFMLRTSLFLEWEFQLSLHRSRWSRVLVRLRNAGDSRVDACNFLNPRGALDEEVGPSDLRPPQFDGLPSPVLWYSCCLPRKGECSALNAGNAQSASWGSSAKQPSGPFEQSARRACRENINT